ncbi:MAG: CRISPR-associated helicase Cas3' [Candidatus Caenarcaniphilales bacterium]|nr:CRISPR-associated helicase Cas3' [Candidatus Caenarcaniphilales bacterium]
MNTTVSTPVIAHLTSGMSASEHLLEDHLLSVACQARTFAERFKHPSWGYLLGLWHDLGKYSLDFQQYIRGRKNIKKYDRQHAITGALYAREWLQNTKGLEEGSPDFMLACNLLCYAIAGHHAGLANREALERKLEDSPGRKFLDKLKSRERIPERILNPEIKFSRLAKGQERTLLIRLLFSCLIDADRLDTEAFMNPEQSTARKQPESWTMEVLKEVFDRGINAKLQSLQNPDSELNSLRKKVLEDCRNAAQQSPGIFSLTVPTGGGKTLSSMAFALNHAIAHGKDRIIYVIPYTSIIEQNAQVFREAFTTLGDPVLEHHSNFDPVRETDDEKESDQTPEDITYSALLATENWDYPIIVTTNVQFFESLYSNRPTACRKLHNITNSVVIFDEAHLFPVNYAAPILEVIDQLTKHYDVTCVLCSATPAWHSLSQQPSDSEKSNPFRKLGSIKEIVQDSDMLQEKLGQRIQLKLHHSLSETSPAEDWDSLATEIVNQTKSSLTIVNLKKSARELYKSIFKQLSSTFPSSQTKLFHLSTWMCAAHRSDKLQEIKSLLADEKSHLKVIVISTQLVEAGVDIDFPVVYRAVSGLDSIAQAGGRCNREGKLNKGDLIVFKPPQGHNSPKGHLSECERAFDQLRRHHKQDLLSLDAFNTYFAELFFRKQDNNKKAFDDKGILGYLDYFDFAEASQNFKLIEKETIPVIVPYGQRGQQLIDKIDNLEKPDFLLVREAQRFSVNLYQGQFNNLKNSGVIKSKFEDQLHYLPSISRGANLTYSAELGLQLDSAHPEESLYI